MNNLGDISAIDPKELPEGFTTSDPTKSAGGGGPSSDPADSEAKSRELQRQAILEQALLPGALERLKRIKLVKAEKASAVESMIVSMAMQGKLPGPINEGKLIEMLEGIGAQKGAASTGKINIQRKKYAFDSDDDSDDDDDLL